MRGLSLLGRTENATTAVAMEESRAKATVCGQEALDLLNCVAQSPYDQDKYVRLLQALRDCVVNKVYTCPLMFLIAI